MRRQLTSKNLDVLQVGASTSLENNLAARRAARVLEGEGLALLDLEGRVEELGLGESDGNKGRDGSDRVLHFELFEGRRKQILNERREEAFD